MEPVLRDVLLGAPEIVAWLEPPEDADDDDEPPRSAVAQPYGLQRWASGPIAFVASQDDALIWTLGERGVRHDS